MIWTGIQVGVVGLVMLNGGFVAALATVIILTAFNMILNGIVVKQARAQAKQMGPKVDAVVSNVNDAQLLALIKSYENEAK